METRVTLTDDVVIGPISALIRRTGSHLFARELSGRD